MECKIRAVSPRSGRQTLAPGASLGEGMRIYANSPLQRATDVSPRREPGVGKECKIRAVSPLQRATDVSPRREPGVGKECKIRAVSPLQRAITVIPRDNPSGFVFGRRCELKRSRMCASNAKKINGGFSPGGTSSGNFVEEPAFFRNLFSRQGDAGVNRWA